MACKTGHSKFIEKVFVAIKAAPEHSDVVSRVIAALERLLDRNHQDSRLILQLSHILQSFSSLEPKEFQKKLTRAIRHLEKPASTAVVKTIKQAVIADLSPKVLENPDLDTIAVISQLPMDIVSSSKETPDLLKVGDELINVATASPKDVRAVARKIKAEAKALEKAEEAKVKAIEEEEKREALAMAVESEQLPELQSELAEATQVLNNLLRSLPRKGALSNLAALIEETRSLLEFTRQQLDQRPMPQESEPLEVH